jgi:acetyl-CoA carboxylase biotin carboxyl carrier protein
MSETPPLRANDVPAILREFAASGWRSMVLRAGEVAVVASREDEVLEAPASAPAAPVSAAPVSAAPAPAKAPATAPAAARSREGLVPVCSPVAGTFYLAPQPGAPPFVQVGQRVEAEDTVGIVEVMKLMNHVAAGAPGEVVEVLVVNGQAVEDDQELMLLRPALERVA